MTFGLLWIVAFVAQIGYGKDTKNGSTSFMGIVAYQTVPIIPYGAVDMLKDLPGGINYRIVMAVHA